MAQSLQDGKIYQYTATGAVVNGQLVVVGRMAGVALNSATGAGQKVSVAMEGVFSLPSVATGAKTVGTLVGYRTTGSPYKVAAVADSCTGAIWGTSGAELVGARYALGTVWEGAATSATTLKVKLIGGPMIPFNG